MDLEWLPKIVLRDDCPPSAERALREQLGDPWTSTAGRWYRGSFLYRRISDPVGLLRTLGSTYYGSNMLSGVTHCS